LDKQPENVFEDRPVIAVVAKTVAITNFAMEIVGTITPSEFQQINEQLIAYYGEGGWSSWAYLAGVLTQAGRTLAYADFLPASPELIPEPLLFSIDTSDLSAAATTLLAVDAAYQTYRQTSNIAGITACRQAVKRAKDRIQALLAHPLLTPAAQQQYIEIMEWISIWWGTPDIFATWLALRQQATQHFTVLPRLPSAANIATTAQADVANNKITDEVTNWETSDNKLVSRKLNYELE
jgi:hypothetical protein